MKYFLLLFTICYFTSCEVYNIPKGSIPISNSKMGCNANTNTQQKNNFTTQLAINIDSTRLQYSFTLPPCYTAWLQPSALGKPVIQYLIIDDKDTVSIPNSTVTFKSGYSFKKYGNQKFLLIIKAP
jgi:hypothetical protein